MPLSGDAKPRPKAVSLARGTRRFHRKVASAKQWQAIIATKGGPCRVCGSKANGRVESRITFHHLISRAHGGDDKAENIVPLCQDCHALITRGDVKAARKLARSLEPEELAYMEARR